MALTATACTADDGVRTGSATTVSPLAAPVEVTPDHGLRPGDAVEVRGHGFVPGETVSVRLCAGAHCDVGELGRTRAADDGSAVLTVRPERVVVGRAGVELDCADPAARCRLSMGPPDDPRYAGEAPLAFSADLGPLVTPVLSVSPSRRLRDGDRVRITGRRFPPGDHVRVSQCLEEASCPLSNSDVVVGPDGRFAITRAVSRLVTVDGRMALECAPERCELRAITEGPDPTFPARPVALDFDPDGPLPLLPTLTVRPSDGLVDGQRVVVVAERLAPTARLVVHQCAADGTTCRFTGVEAEARRGRVDVGLEVARSFDTVDGRVDCRTTRCTIAVQGRVLLGPMIAPDPVPLAFAPPARR